MTGALICGTKCPNVFLMQKNPAEMKRDALLVVKYVARYNLTRGIGQ